MHITDTDTLDMIFNLAEMAAKPQCLRFVHSRVGQAGTLAAPPRDSGDLSQYASAACSVVLEEAYGRDFYLSQGLLTPLAVATRMRMIAYVASTLLPAVVEDYDGCYTLVLRDDGVFAPLYTLNDALAFAVTRLTGYLAEHDAGAWVDPNAVAGAVVDIHDAALAVETWWSLTAPPALDSHCSDGASGD